MIPLVEPGNSFFERRGIEGAAADPPLFEAAEIGTRRVKAADVVIEEINLHPPCRRSEECFGKGAPGNIVADYVKFKTDATLGLTNRPEQGREKLPALFKELYLVPPGKGGFGIPFEQIEEPGGTKGKRFSFPAY